MVDKTVVGSVLSYLREVQDRGTDVRFGVVFGSQATGDAHKWSDIDLLVVSPRFDVPYTRADIHRLWHIAAEVDERIEPIPCGEIEWREDDSSAIVEMARREGEIVRLEGRQEDKEGPPTPPQAQ
jgi:predicted nucleotidyltransferase